MQTGASTRRSVLRRGAVVALGTAALVSALPLTTYADDGDNDKDDKPHPPAPPRGPAARRNTFMSDVSTVAQTAASGDFASGNPGTDPLRDGRLHLHHATSTTEGKLEVELNGAAPNVSYDVTFWPLAAGKARESLGTIGPTNKDGNLHAQTPSALNGTNRLGVFVIVRHDGTEAGKDEFVSTMGG